MKYKQRTITSTYYDSSSREWKTYEIPTPEMERDISGLINTGKALVEGVKAVSLFGLLSIVIFRMWGVM